MQLHLKDSYFDLSSTLIMANVDLDPQDTYTSEEMAELLHDYEDCGATFVEFSVDNGSSLEEEKARICEALDWAKGSKLIPAVYTSKPEIMSAAAEHGAQLVVDPLALRASGALETVARTGLAVCLCYDQNMVFKEDKDDPCAAVAEFFYERIDACLNAKIERQRLLLDPMIGVDASVDFRLKMIGRLKTFNSFGLPLSCELPHVVEEKGLPGEDRMPVVSAVALFADQQGIRILRTRKVYDIALAINTWHVLHLSARPFKLSRAIGRTLKKALAKRRERRNQSQ